MTGVSSRVNKNSPQRVPTERTWTIIGVATCRQLEMVQARFGQPASLPAMITLGKSSIQMELSCLPHEWAPTSIPH